MIVGYIRVSTVDQNLARQEETMQEYNVEKIYSEKISAKNKNRPQLKAMLDYVREGDTIVVHDFSRLARNTKDLLEIVELLESKNVKLKSKGDDIDTSSPVGKFMLTIIGAVAELERANILERQKEGIAIAKEQGKFKGKQVKNIDETLYNELYTQYKNREITKIQFAQALNVSRPTLDRYIKAREEL